MSMRACAKTWTGQLQMADGRLPNFKALKKELVAVGMGCTLRGVEASLVGELFTRDSVPHLRVEATGEVMRLAPLTYKVQWDVAGKREAPITEDERGAHARLQASWRNSAKGNSVEVVGPVGALRGTGDGAYRVLQVRQFRELRSKATK
ncbi:MAG: hypothetical protein AAF581_09930 [Planctomycetota bacterium]